MTVTLVDLHCCADVQNCSSPGKSAQGDEATAIEFDVASIARISS